MVGDVYLDDLMLTQGWLQIFDATFSWHWDCGITNETRWAFPAFKDTVAVLPADGIHPLGHGHPRAWRDLERWYVANNIPFAEHLAPAIQMSKVFVADNTSALYYAMALGKPLVVLDAPWYRRHVNHGLRFWEHADVGERINEPRDLSRAIRTMIDEPTKHAEAVRQAIEDLFPMRDGLAALRVCEALRRVC